MDINVIYFSKGVYALLKEHIRVNNKLSGSNRTRLETKLKGARLLPREQLPHEVVAANSSVSIRDMLTGELKIFNLVVPAEARTKHNKVSLLSQVGMAVVGNRQGDQVEWEMPDGLKKYLIEEVSLMK